jgi:glycosyltransferase involved in cell wall biosynthesis
VDNVNEYLKASDIFVFPTKQEAFGISLIEAMACGLPPVAAATGAIPSIISGGRDGLLIPPGDSAALAEAAGELITDKAKREEMGIRAAETVAGSFTWDTVKEKYRQVIEKL